MIVPKDHKKEVLGPLTKPRESLSTKKGDKCAACGKPEKKYRCSKTQLISCSFECYKANLIKSAKKSSKQAK